MAAAARARRVEHVAVANEDLVLHPRIPLANSWLGVGGASGKRKRKSVRFASKQRGSDGGWLVRS